MMQSIRAGTQNTGFKLLIFMIILSFAGFGLEQVIFGSSGTSVAEVNGTEITPQELQVAIEGQKRQLMQIFGDNIDPEMLDDDRIRPRALEEMIERTVLLQAATDNAMVASSRAIGDIVGSIEAFKVDGAFNADQYKVVLANAGYSPERFRREQAQQIILSQLQQGVLASDFVTNTELAAAAVATAEERDVRYLIVANELLRESAEVSQESVREVYDRDPSRWTSEASVVADYIVVSRDDFLAPVDSDALEEQFQSVQDEYTVAEQTLIAHILLIQGDDETVETYTQRIDDVASRVAAGENFAELAAEVSDDIGSAALGGELGFTDGTVFPQPMEEAISTLGVGDVSAGVETDAGTHFIRIQERVAGETPDYEQLKADLAKSMQEAEAEQTLLVTVDELRELSFNAADLQQPADALSLTVAQSAPVSLSIGEGVFAESAVRETLFSEEVYEAGNNSAILELSGNRFVVVRVAEKRPAEILPFSKVANSIRGDLETNARVAAELALLESLRSRRADGERLEEIATAGDYEWRVELGARRIGSLLPAEVVTVAFAMQEGAGATLESTTLVNGDLAIVELAGVEQGQLENLSSGEQTAMAEQLAQLQGRLSMLEYRTALRDNAEIVTR
ncbi:SurA N-terminal domain-containing protein [Luminiphilus sp. nBUS_16]|uniref:peptidylprolyl isomerase n=1 Tax=Luminiphilus sp. nBUS_16 TaxID=3395315 RepID=UPI003EBDFF27